MEDGHARGEEQGLGFVGCRHAGAYFLVEVIETMTKVFEACVNAARTRVRVRDGRAASDIDGNVRGGRLDGSAVEEVAAVASKNLVTGIKPGSDVAGGPLLADVNAVHCRLTPGLFSLGDESRLTLLAVTAGEPVRG
jgi:hypothetical protein